MFVGDRVVVRYRLAPGAPADWRDAAGATLSDVTGVIVNSGDPLVLDTAAVPVELITSVRLLPYRAVRNNEIRDVALRAIDAAESDEVLGWRVRAGATLVDSAVPRNSAVPAIMGARLDSTTVAALQQWYASRGLRAVVELPERLVSGGTAVGAAVGGEFHRLVRVADDGTETDIVTVAADDLTRGTSLRADGFRLHHRVAYRDLGD
ncbi:MAG TPA: hypothetical protein PK331_06390 [Gordonia sp. (in: high G+C Gram-positive bacteria)]|uniref:GNAT family N-acetyltransferase, cg3035/Rv0428c family n=1 Tax=unclassified Gordonia (in: high G+C Gram-positive bacteria) TaxID=2657482 RepID=UPI000F9C93D1|nr:MULTISPECIES: hypothetical protein [unclassified Gordonia (in: high G+C Gram-positive bacteria)]RUP41486.1 MAG: hypothetical protein EKK60_01070 [Gordonia sp. (in: high G+C Gram-positive bacteria)]HNP57143.1 hypothetical protein [Gordonia sp. (in: high G+C Gram-positive bacteria)]HRC50537.1 hypothetical protein [Gordonia sp. (in: high G+C Gram-positive bacteria)]